MGSSIIAPWIMSAASSQGYGTLSTSVPTSATSLPQGNSKDIDDITSHENDAWLVNLNASCIELPVDLSTPPILESDQTTEISTIFSAPIELTVDAKELMFNHFDMASNLGDDSVSNDLLHVMRTSIQLLHSQPLLLYILDQLLELVHAN